MAPSGSYTVTILATDDAGNPSVVVTSVTVPAAAKLTATAAIGITGATDVPLETTPITSATPSLEATSTSRTTLSATPTSAGSTSFSSPTPIPSASSSTTLPTNVLWGAAAASVIGAATAIALENARRREEEEAAQKAAAEANAAAFNAVEAVIDEAEAARKAALWQEQKDEEEQQANLVRDFREADNASVEDYKAYQARKFKEEDQASIADYAAYQAKKFKEEAASISGAAGSTASTETTTWWESTKEKITTFLEEKIILPIQYFNYVMKSDPDPKGDLFEKDNLIATSSTLTVLGAFIDQKFLNGKASEFGQSIHTPTNIIANALSLVEGAGIQIVEDMSFGYFGKITKLNIENGSETFLYGRNLGRIITTIGAAVGLLQGIVTTTVAVDTLIPTITGGSVCAVLTGGSCLVLGAAAVAAEAAIGMVGVAETVYSGSVLKYIKNNSVSNSADKTLSYGTNKGNTRDNSKLLNKNLQAAGIERPDDYAAHHLAPSTSPEAKIAREILKKFDIDINSAENGIYIPKSLNSHLNSHRYMDAVNDALSEANTKEEALEILKKIRETIKIKGDYP